MAMQTRICVGRDVSAHDNSPFTVLAQDLLNDQQCARSCIAFVLAVCIVELVLDLLIVVRHHPDIVVRIHATWAPHQGDDNGTTYSTGVFYTYLYFGLSQI